MSRSKHTRPRAIRAADRVRNPWQPRGAGDPSRMRAVRRLLKAAGVVAAPPASRERGPWQLPRIEVRRPRPGHRHPADRRAIASLLRFFGEECVYGVCAVELRPGPPADRRLTFGRLEVPGRVVLFAQPPSPWRVMGRLDREWAVRFARAGAELEHFDGGGFALHWSDEALERFMLFDVLMHEIGHHLLQHYEGKRAVRVARTRDHEAFAEAFARRCRRAWRAAAAER